MTESEACIVCGNQCMKDGRKMPWEESTVEQNQNLNNQLAVMLLVRNVLGLSQETLKSLLQQRGHPTCWGLKMCDPCRRLFQETYQIHTKLSKLNTEYNSLIKTLKGLWQNGAKSSDLDTDKNRRCRKRSNLKLPADVLPKDVTVSQWIRQKVSKSIDVTKTKLQTNRKLSAPPFRQRRQGKKTICDFVQFDIAKEESVEVKCDANSGSYTNPSEQVEVVQEKLESTSYFVIPNTFTNDDDDYSNNETDVCHPIEVESDHGNTDETFYSDSKHDLKAGKDTSLSCQSSETSIPRSKSNIIIDVQKRIDVFSVPQPIKEELGFKCPLCTRISYSKCSCHGHILRAHYKDSRPFHCHLCIKQFKREVILRTHLLEHHNDAKTPLDGDNDDNDKPTEFPPITDDSVTFEHDKKVNKDESRDTELQKCEICPKTKKKVYKNKESLEAHKKFVHMGISKPHVCIKCGKSFRLKSVFRHHMHVHKRQDTVNIVKQAYKNKLPTYCYHCNKQFKSNSLLRKHLTCKVHSKEYPYLCEYCTRGFMQKSSLENHRTKEHYVLANLQPFKCSYCEKILTSQRVLEHHIRTIHTGNTLYKCEPCKLGFMYESFYKRHLSVVHEKEKHLLCTYCPKRFSSANHLQTHLRTHTGEKPYKCTTCGKEYSDRPTYRRHLETHSEQYFACNVCDKTFKVWHSFRNHLKHHGITAASKSSRDWAKNDNKNDISAPIQIITTVDEMDQSTIVQELKVSV